MCKSLADWHWESFWNVGDKITEKSDPGWYINVTIQIEKTAKWHKAGSTSLSFTGSVIAQRFMGGLSAMFSSRKWWKTVDISETNLPSIVLISRVRLHAATCKHTEAPRFGVGGFWFRWKMKKFFSSGGGNDQSSFVGKTVVVGRCQCVVEEVIAEGKNGFSLFLLFRFR